MFKKKEPVRLSPCEYDDININHYAFSTNTNMKRNQMSALFVMLKNRLIDGEYTIDTPLKTFDIPEEFEAPEIMAISKYFEATAWHIFIDEESYIDFDFESFKINLEPSVIDECKEILKKAESFKSDVSVADFSFNKYAGWLWDKYLEEQYDKLTAMGNRYLKFGDFFVYDDELDERKIQSREDFEAARVRNYILLKSKLNEYRIVFIDMKLKMVLATELDDLEKEYMGDILHPNTDDNQP